MIALIFAAQLAATSPTPVIKAESGQTRTLADVARERKLGKTGVPGGTLSVAGAPVPAGHAPAIRQPEIGGALTLSDSYESWTSRRETIQAETDAAKETLAQADATMPSVICRGRSAACVVANEARESGLLQYRMKVNEADAKMNKLREQAARAGVPGLVR